MLKPAKLQLFKYGKMNFIIQEVFSDLFAYQYMYYFTYKSIC